MQAVRQFHLMVFMFFFRRGWDEWEKHTKCTIIKTNEERKKRLDDDCRPVAVLHQLNITMIFNAFICFTELHNITNDNNSSSSRSSSSNNKNFAHYVKKSVVYTPIHHQTATYKPQHWSLLWRTNTHAYTYGRTPSTRNPTRICTVVAPIWKISVYLNRFRIFDVHITHVCLPHSCMRLCMYAEWYGECCLSRSKWMRGECIWRGSVRACVFVRV